MKRVLFFAYGVAAHALFFGVYGYMALFVTGLGAAWLPKTMDGPISNLSTTRALSVNVALVLIFGLQHSAMARPAFKSWWTKFVPAVIERSTYVWISNLIMIALFAFWQPMNGTVWNVETPALRIVLWGMCAFGWILVPVASLMINHFDLFGTRQVWLQLRGREYQHLPFRTPMLYKHVRHPLYVGWLMTFWMTPTMSSGHLLFASLMTAYIFVALRFEERDLVKHFGQKYAEYRNEVPALVPRVAARPDAEVKVATQQ